MVEALDLSINSTGGAIRLVIPELDYEDEQELKEDGTFGFRRVPLQQSTENLLIFKISDKNGKLVATAGRPITQSKEAARPTGRSTSTAVISKSILLEVQGPDGKPKLRELFQALQTLPKSENFQFQQSGNTELVRLPLYQQKRKFQEINVPVDSSLPKGTLVDLNVNIDELSFITVKGKIGETAFDAAIEPPSPREMPTNDEVESLEHKFNEALAYVPVGKKAVVSTRYKRAKQSFEAASKRNDKEQSIHDFEEMEEIVGEISKAGGPPQPPKEFFDDLVGECQEINRYAAQAAAKEGQPHDPRKIEKATDHAKHAEGEASKMGQMAAAQDRNDLQDETEQIKKQLSGPKLSGPEKNDTTTRLKPIPLQSICSPSGGSINPTTISKN